MLLALSTRGFLYVELACLAAVAVLGFTWARWARDRQGPDRYPDE